MLIYDIALLLDLIGNSEGTKLLILTVIFVWCLLRQRTGESNSGLKSAIIVTDALKHLNCYSQQTTQKDKRETK